MDAAETPVSEVMQPEFAHMSPDDGLDFVEEIMTLGRIRHFPVMRDGELVGLVSQRDLLAASLTRMLDFDGTHRRAFLRSVKVAEVMTTKVRTVSPDATLASVARLFGRHKIGCAPVVGSDGAVVGLVTESDLLARAYL
ncbi:MAG: CBS domain-containing protein [Deltaproteobacteria bacterium]|nr:CBS domain-containing protein [Deltaproteobacteria bacterium]MBW2446655.1 CBS domain-containing protein [Deltaproteobacteria bacterium]